MYGIFMDTTNYLLLLSDRPLAYLFASGLIWLNHRK